MTQNGLNSSPNGGGIATLTQHFRYNYWAYQRILAQMAKLNETELREPNQTTHDTAFQLLLHTVDTEWSWRIVCQEGVLTPLLWTVEQLPDLDSVVRYWQGEQEKMLAYLNGLSDGDLEREVDFGTLQGNPPKYAKVLHLLSHILFHSITHRSELAIYLTQCGHSPGDMEFLNYVDPRPS